MPVNDHLKWVEIKDFSKGLYDGQDFLIPPDAFAVMEDCYPRVGGGLRAFYKSDTTSLPTTGVDSISAERIEIISPLITSTGIAYLLVTSHSTTGVQKWYYWAVGASSWSKIKTFTAPSSYANRFTTSVTTYHDNTNGRNVWAIVTTHNKSDSSEDGLYLVRWDTGGITFVENSAFTVTPIAQYQARLIYPHLNTLVWTDPGAVATPPAANFLTLQSGNNDVRDIIAGLMPYAPNTLLVSTIGSGWWMIEGDITDPVVRQMGDDFNPWFAQKMARAQDGIVFFEGGTGIFQTQNMAANFKRLDPQLLPHPAAPMHGFANVAGYLLAPQGRVMSWESGAWFTLSVGTGSSPIYAWYDQPSPGVNGLTFNKGVYGAQYKASGAIAIVNMDERAGARLESYRVKTAPVRDAGGRQMVVREVQVGVDSFSAETTVAVTCGGVTQTSTALGVGSNVVSFLFPARAEYLDVLVVPASNHSGVEAPVLEYMRIGARPDGHQIHY